MLILTLIFVRISGILCISVPDFSSTFQGNQGSRMHTQKGGSCHLCSLKLLCHIKYLVTARLDEWSPSACWLTAAPVEASCHSLCITLHYTMCSQPWGCRNKKHLMCELGTRSLHSAMLISSRCHSKEEVEREESQLLEWLHSILIFLTVWFAAYWKKLILILR